MKRKILQRTISMLGAGVFCLAVLFPVAGTAATITKELTIQVYQICDNAGANCAQLGPVSDPFYATATAAIWSQAGIGVAFNYAGTIKDSNFLMVNDDVTANSFASLQALYGGGGPSSTTVYMFLNHGVGDNVKPHVAYGEGWFGAGGLVVDMDLVMGFSSASGLGRIDTVAHELGHNLGLVGPAEGGDAGGHSPNKPGYLMASGEIRYVPDTIADVYPSGLGLDQIPADQIAAARQSSLLSDVPAQVPEPATLAFAGMGLCVIVVMRRRQA